MIDEQRRKHQKRKWWQIFSPRPRVKATSAKLEKKSSRTTLDKRGKTSDSSWYAAQNAKKSLRQIVVHVPLGGEIPPQVENLVPPSDMFIFMQSPWGVITTFMSPPDPPGPLVFVRAEGQVKDLRRCPIQVAFSFYRMASGGLLTLFLDISCPKIELRTGNPVIFENHQNLESDDSIKVMEALISKNNLEICFTDSGEKGPCTGYFVMEAPLSVECQKVLRREWEQLIEYHRSIPGRSFQQVIDQYERENPIEETPVLPR